MFYVIDLLNTTNIINLQLRRHLADKETLCQRPIDLLK